MTVRSQVLAAVLLALGTQGCATIMTLSSDFVEGGMYESPQTAHPVRRVYSGVVEDGICAGSSRGGDISSICIVDLPLSLCADTIVLPYTLYTQIRYGNFRPRLVPEIHEREARRREQAQRNALEYCRVHGATSDHEAKLCRELESGAAPDGAAKEP